MSKFFFRKSVFLCAYVVEPVVISFYSSRPFSDISLSDLIFIFPEDTELQIDQVSAAGRGTLSYSVKGGIPTYEIKLEALKLKLKAEKESKRKMKRKLKIKMAQKVTKLKQRLSAKKRMLRELKGVNAREVTEIAMINNEFDQPTVNDIEIEFVANEQTGIDGSASNIQPGQSANIEESADDVFDIRLIHSYAKPYAAESVRMYKCHSCGYKTPKKDNLVKHMVSCVSGKILDEKCPVCGKSFTYDGLRGHLRYFAIGKHITKNKHAQYTPQQHKTMLEHLKMKRIN